MNPLDKWQEQYGEAFSQVGEVVRTVELATRTRSGAPGETYRVEIVKALPERTFIARYAILAEGRWVSVNLGGGAASALDEALRHALSIVATCAHSAR